MTVEQEVDALTAAVDTLKSTVVSKKATLDASVSDAQAATALATTAKTATLSARDQAAAFKDAAYSAAQSAASAVAYQDLTALALSKAVTAVDVFIYDTSKDSDGGAWRHRCAGTSWYNETLNTTTRGSRREFPAVAVIVVETYKLIIFDGDDPTLPMWMVLNPCTGTAPQTWRGGRIAQSVSAMNGLLALCIDLGDAYDVSSGVVLMNFPNDTLGRISHQYLYGFEQISVRNVGSVLPVFRTGGLISVNANDVAMTVLPDAPIDPATGLPVPTIAVATEGGVSFIKDDGTVWSPVLGAYAQANLAFNEDWSVISVGRSADRCFKVGTVNDQFAFETGGGNNFQYVLKLDIRGQTFSLLLSDNGSSAAAVDFIRGGPLSRLALNREAPASSMVAYTTSTYNTGWMPGAIKGAFLSSTDTASLVGSGELVSSTAQSGTITQTAPSEGEPWWTAEGIGQWSISSNALTRSAGGTWESLRRDLGMEANKTYRLTFDLAVNAGSVSVYSNHGTSVLVASQTGSYEVDFTPVGANASKIQFSSGSLDGAISNISVKLADTDRSVNNKGLIVNGTVTRSAVATGAELVAYSGFSASNYLEQPYNSALDFGTGDFCVMGWAYTLNGVGQTILSRRKPDLTGAGFEVGYYGGVGLGFKAYRDTGAQSAASTAISPFSTWSFVVVLRVSGVMQLYINGLLVGSYSDTGNLSDAAATLCIGKRHDGTFAYGGKLALWRISATAPTAEQIKKIYEDEKVLFQENAACTLYGASDAVTALAHDPDTGLLHVGTSAGRSTFKGLRRVANTTQAVGTAISAANGMVVEE